MSSEFELPYNDTTSCLDKFTQNYEDNDLDSYVTGGSGDYGKLGLARMRPTDERLKKIKECHERNIRK